MFILQRKISAKDIRKILVVGASLVLIVLVIAIIFDTINTSTNEHVYKISDSIFYAIFGILVGFLTLFGLYLTYEQLILMEDRIDSYEDFYEVAIKLLNENRSKFVHFSGSTLMPGHISFGDENYVGEHGSYFGALDTRIRKFHEKNKGKKDFSKFILPEDYEVPYEKYLNKKYKNRGSGNDFDGTQKSINDKKEEMQHIQSRVEHYSIIKKEKSDSSFLNSFYLSNGKTMIFAMSITHEQAEIINGEDKEIRPVFVGFKTQKASIIDAFEERFDRQWNNIKETSPNL